MKKLKRYLTKPIILVFAILLACLAGCGEKEEKDSFASVARVEEKNYSYDEFHYDSSSDSVYCNYGEADSALKKMCTYVMGCTAGDLLSECRAALIDEQNVESILDASGAVEISFNGYCVRYRFDCDTKKEEVVVYNK